MRVAVIKETRPEEHRVALTPAGAEALRAAGHEVVIEAGAGAGSGFSDEAFASAGARVLGGADAVVAAAGMLLKVKEPTEAEFSLLRPGLILFSFLSLPTNPILVRALVESGVCAVAYESVRLADGTHPILVPMSRIAGRMAGVIAAQYLRKPGPGRGKLPGGIETASPARAIVVGYGSAGREAAQVLRALGAETAVAVRAPAGGEVDGFPAVRSSELADHVPGLDMLIGAVHVDSGIAPKLMSRGMVRSMGPGAVIVDVGIDQGGICETSRPTSHADPVYLEEGVLHYCVPNMPGAVPRTSTEALTATSLPYVLRIAGAGLDSLRRDPELGAAAQVVNGRVVARHVAEAAGLEWTELASALS